MQLTIPIITLFLQDSHLRSVMRASASRSTTSSRLALLVVQQQPLGRVGGLERARDELQRTALREGQRHKGELWSTESRKVMLRTVVEPIEQITRPIPDALMRSTSTFCVSSLIVMQSSCEKKKDRRPAGRAPDMPTLRGESVVPPRAPLLAWGPAGSQCRRRATDPAANAAIAAPRLAPAWSTNLPASRQHI
jgi:hypothetical protein